MQLLSPKLTTLILVPVVWRLKAAKMHFPTPPKRTNPYYFDQLHWYSQVLTSQDY